MHDSESLAQITLELVSIPSESGREEAVCNYILEKLNETAPDYLKRRGNRIAATYGCDPDRSADCVVLVGHMDTVPHAGHPGPRIEGGCVHGLGSSDMKGALAVMLALASRFRSGGSPVGLVFYDCEEGAFNHNGLRIFFEQEPWLKGVGSAILMEPTANQVELGCMGTLHAEVVFPGRAAHSARPWQGDNAIHKAGAFLTRLAELPERVVQDGPARYREVVNATMAEGGISRNVIPDRFKINVNLRFAPDRSLEDATRHVRSLVPEECDLRIVDMASAAPPRLDAPLLHRLADEFGLTVQAKQAWTDVAQFAQHGVPAVNFGPGAGAQAHQQNEFVSIQNLVDSFQILSTLLELD